MGSRRLRTALLALLLGCGPADSPPPAAPAPVAPGPAGPPPAGPAPSAAVVPGTVDLDRAPPTEEVRTAAAAPCAGCDIVVISVCSLRRDHVGAYGVIDGLTPTIDRLAAESVRFDTAYAGSNFTLASLTALLTGRFGSSTGVVGWGKGLGDGVPTLPEVLGFYGYRTGAFTVDAASGLRPDYGLDRGFQRMRVVPPPRGTPDGRHGTTGDTAPGASAAPAAAWIGEQPKDRPIFAFFHSRTAHFPFVVSDEGADDDPTGVVRAFWEEGQGGGGGAGMPGRVGGNQRSGLLGSANDDATRLTRRAGDAGVAIWRREYAKAVARMDADVAVILDAVAARGRADRTVVVLVADHGEALDDNGELLHGGSYFDAVVHVPLLVRAPGIAPGSSAALVGHVDVLPTLLDLVGVQPPALLDGVSMRPLLERTGEQIRSTTLVEGSATNAFGGDVPGAVISPPWALLHQSFPCTRDAMPEGNPPLPGEAPAPGAPPMPGPGRPGSPPTLRKCLFNLDADPGEKTDLADAHPEQVQALLGRWQGYREAVAGRAVPRELQLDPAFVELLQRTGYDFQNEPKAEPR